jgi:hypothetical protein
MIDQKIPLSCEFNNKHNKFKCQRGWITHTLELVKNNQYFIKKNNLYLTSNPNSLDLKYINITTPGESEYFTFQYKGKS